MQWVNVQVYFNFRTGGGRGAQLKQEASQAAVAQGLKQAKKNAGTKQNAGATDV